MVKPDSKVLRLPTGRLISFFDLGDKRGFPILLHTGHVSSGILAGFIDDLAAKYGFRVISVNRPGIGKSDNYDYDLASVADDSKELMKNLRLKKYIIVSLSAGVMFMFAICKNNKNVCLGVSLGAFGPYQLIKNQISGLESQYFKAKSSIIPKMFLAFFNRGSWLVDIVANFFLDGLPKMNGRERMKDILKWDRSLAVSNGVEPMLRERALIVLDWTSLVRFSNQDIKYLFFHGERDRSAPVSILSWYQKQLSNSNSVIYANENHFAPLNHLEEIFIAMKKEVNRLS